MKPVTATEEEMGVQNQNEGRAWVTDYEHGFPFPLQNMLSLKLTVKGTDTVLWVSYYFKGKRVG